MISSLLVLCLDWVNIMNKRTTKRLAEINSGINLKNAKASIANQPQDTLDAETARVLVNRGIQHAEAVARAKTIRETIDRYNDASSASIDSLKDALTKMFASPLEMCWSDISNALTQKEEK